MARATARIALALAAIGVTRPSLAPAAGKSRVSRVPALASGRREEPRTPEPFGGQSDAAPATDLHALFMRPRFEERRYRNRRALERHRDTVRQKLAELSGLHDLLPLPRWRDVTLLGAARPRRTGMGTAFEERAFSFVQRVRARDRFGGTLRFDLDVPGYLYLPSGLDPAVRHPAIVYNHYHGGYFQQGADELRNDYEGWHFLHRLMNEGYVVITTDAPGHGHRLDVRYRQIIEGRLTRRRDNGEPFVSDYRHNRGEDAEGAWDRTATAYGVPRFNVRLQSDLATLNLAATLPMVDPARIAVLGMSMGSTRSSWQGAFAGYQATPRVRIPAVAAVVGLGTLFRVQDEIAVRPGVGNGAKHFPPGLLQVGDMEIVTLAGAGIPTKLLIGTRDSGAPGSQTILNYNEAAWRTLGVGDRFHPTVMEGEGHYWPARYIDETLDWLRPLLRPTPALAAQPATSDGH
jgi:dienelactone hydrolase